MNVRRATPSDARSIAEVHVRTWQRAYRGLIDDAELDALDVHERAERWRAILDGDVNRTHVAVVDGQLVGFVSEGRARDEDARDDVGEILALYVAPEAWGTGAGRSLLAHALEQLAASGFASVLLWMLADNARALRFYRTAGFVPDGTERRRPGSSAAQLLEIRLARRIERAAQGAADARSS